jgi:hypothetical protein
VRRECGSIVRSRRFLNCGGRPLKLDVRRGRMTFTAGSDESIKPLQVRNLAWIRPLSAFIFNVFALLFFMLAVLGPLLPSEGLPSTLVLTIWVGGPCLLMLISAFLSRSTVAKIICSLEAICFCAIAHHLYSMLVELQKHALSPGP